MDITNYTLNALNNYYSALSHTGYISYDRVYKLIVISFIEDMMCNSEYIDFDDLDYILKAVQCLQGDCIIPFQYNSSQDIQITKECNK